VIRNFENKISRIDLASGSDSAARPVATTTPAGVDTPTTAIFLAEPSPRLIVVNSQFANETPHLPFTLSEIPLK
jgi:hypothetical protein